MRAINKRTINCVTLTICLIIFVANINSHAAHHCEGTDGKGLGDTYNTLDGRKIKVVGTTCDEGMFAIGVHDNKLYAGTYSLGANPKLYSYPEWEYRTSVDADESIYEIFSTGPFLYLNTENLGKIYKGDGDNFSQVHRDRQKGRVLGFSIEMFKGNLFATTQTIAKHGGNLIIWKTEDGNSWSKVTIPGNTKGLWVHDFIKYKGKMYAFVSDVGGKGEKVGYYITDNGDSWRWVDVKRDVGKVGFSRAAIWNDYLYIIGKGDTAGEHYYKIFKFDGISFAPVYENSTKPYATDIVVYNDKLYLSDSIGWKVSGKGASLYQSYDGKKFEKVFDFREPETSSMEVFNKKLYISTKNKEGNGKLFQYPSD